MPRSVRRPLAFPLRGVIEMQNPAQTPDGFAYRALNVVGFDPIQNRLRGGKRPGTGRILTNQVAGENPVRRMGQVTLTADQFLTPGFFPGPQDGWGQPDFEWPVLFAGSTPIESEALDIDITGLMATVGETTIDLVWSAS